MPDDKERLDLLLVRRGLFPSRRQAQAAIMAGLVLVNGCKLDKAGMRVQENTSIRILGQEHPYVSRGGIKLAKAVAVFHLDLAGKTVMDVGAATGGFTDCALQHGARRVYAVDVGRGQLAWKLRQDPRVILLEKTNIRYLRPEELPELMDCACIDVSFISLTHVLPAVKDLLLPAGEVVALVKPQFEAGPEKVGKGGIVRDASVHEEVLTTIINGARQMGLSTVGLTYSPITGAKGNREYLLYLHKSRADIPFPRLGSLIKTTIKEAWRDLP